MVAAANAQNAVEWMTVACAAAVTVTGNAARRKLIYVLKITQKLMYVLPLKQIQPRNRIRVRL